MRILILTPIEIEFEAVKSHLLNAEWQYIAGYPVLIGLSSSSTKHEVAIIETGQENEETRKMSRAVIKYWHPIACLLVGITRGLRNAEFGDIIVAEKSYGNLVDGIASAANRTTVVPFSPDLVRLCRKVASRQNWWNRLNSVEYQPKVLFGSIASYDQPELLKSDYEDLQAVDADSIGFVESMQEFPGIHCASIRSVSSKLNDASLPAEARGQRIAAAHAAAFTFELIQGVNENLLSKPFMKIDDLAGEIFAFLRPLITPGSKAPNLYQAALLERIQTYIGADWAVIKDKTPAWKYAEGHFVGALSRGLDKQEPLIKELESLLEKGKIISPLAANNKPGKGKITPFSEDVPLIFRSNQQLDPPYPGNNQVKMNNQQPWNDDQHTGSS